MRTGSRLSTLECRACCTSVRADDPVGTCPTCGHTLFAAYDTTGWDGKSWWKELTGRPATLWRYRELLPVRETARIATLGEGFTPVLDLGDVDGASGVRVSAKDDGVMPTGSFKARGMTVAVSRAAELGRTQLFVPSAGNAGTALSAYSARAGLTARVYVPERTPDPIKQAIRSYGAELVEVPGTIREAGEAARTREKGRGSFDMSTLREPYRVEGKKTMGFEIVEQSGPDELPDAILYPTGGGTGLVGMAKAFRELRALGLLERSPRLYAVQTEGCAPVVRALRDGEAKVTPWVDPTTIAPGLLVPAPFASERILEAVRESRGGGVTVTDREIVGAMRELATLHGLSPSPEAAAPYAALPKLVADGAVRPGERVLLYLTGTGLVYSVDELERSVAR
ncbi:MAG TPA: threonine synthase [Thermoplasmata archaeon]|jgi:threonine synthase|nr:threonine synthase [Thermoplasmata archaeon]